MGTPDESIKGSPLVSVILPTYNRPEFLPEAVKSVADQTYKNIELIVVDDHSPQPSREAIDETITSDLDFRYIRHDINKGANEARKTGIRASTGELLAFLDDDDVWKKSKIEQQVEGFRKGANDLGVVYTGQQYVNREGRITYLHIPDLNGTVTKQMLRGEPVGNFSSIMVRRDFLDEVGMPDGRLPSWQDREWLLRLSRHCTFEPVREPLVVRRFVADEQISDNYEAKRDVSYPLFLEKHRSLARKYGCDCENQFVAQLTQRLAKRGIKTGHYREAAKYLLRSLRFKPFDVQTYLLLFVCLGGPFAFTFVRRFSRYYRRCIVRLNHRHSSSKWQIE